MGLLICKPQSISRLCAGIVHLPLQKWETEAQRPMEHQ